MSQNPPQKKLIAPSVEVGLVLVPERLTSNSLPLGKCGTFARENLPTKNVSKIEIGTRKPFNKKRFKNWNLHENCTIFCKPESSFSPAFPSGWVCAVVSCTGSHTAWARLLVFGGWFFVCFTMYFAFWSHTAYRHLMWDSCFLFLLSFCLFYISTFLLPVHIWWWSSWWQHSYDRHQLGGVGQDHHDHQDYDHSRDYDSDLLSVLFITWQSRAREGARREEKKKKKPDPRTQKDALCLMLPRCCSSSSTF